MRPCLTAMGWQLYPCRHSWQRPWLHVGHPVCQSTAGKEGARVSSHAQWRTGIGFCPRHAHSRAPHTDLPPVVRAGEAMAEKNTCEKLMEDNAESGALLQELMEVCDPPAETPQGRAAGPRSQGAAGLAALLRPGLAVPWARAANTLSHPASMQLVPIALQCKKRSAELAAVLREQTKVREVCRVGGREWRAAH